MTTSRPNWEPGDVPSIIGDVGVGLLVVIGTGIDFLISLISFLFLFVYFSNLKNHNSTPNKKPTIVDGLIGDSHVPCSFWEIWSYFAFFF